MVTAFVLMVVTPGSEEKVAAKLAKMKEVKDLGIVYGEYDIIAKVEVDSLDDLQKFILKIRNRIKEIERTSTMISVRA